MMPNFKEVNALPRKAKPGDRGTDDQKELGKLIKEHRESMELSQQGLSDLMKGRIPAQLISRYENGGDHMRVGTYFLFVETFGVTPNDFCPARLLNTKRRIPAAYLHLSEQSQDRIDEIIRSFKENPPEDSKAAFQPQSSDATET